MFHFEGKAESFSKLDVKFMIDLVDHICGSVYIIEFGIIRLWACVCARARR